jgi:Enoyl-(Acyl carrier protein) reductase
LILFWRSNSSGVQIPTHRSHDKDRRVVDQNVQFAKLFDHLRNQPLGFGDIALICANGKSTHTLVAARDLAARNITVNTLPAGFVDTDMNPQNSDCAPAWIATVPLGRYGRPEETAAGVINVNVCPQSVGPYLGYRLGIRWICSVPRLIIAS